MAAITPYGPRNIRHALKSWIPIWLSDRLSSRTGFALLYVIALAADELVEQLYEGTLAALPGAGTPTALALNGQMRGIPRGLTETDDEYVLRLRAWLSTWENAGSAETLVTLVAAFLGAGHVVRHIDRSKNMVTIDAGGVVTKSTAAAWDWDSLYQGTSRAAWLADTWLIIYVSPSEYPVYTDLTDPAWLANWGSEATGLGHQVPRNVVDGLYSILAAFKGAHTWMSAIVWSEDAAQFTGSASLPDGKLADWSRADGSNHQVPARTTVAAGKYFRYWIPRFGG